MTPESLQKIEELLQVKFGNPEHIKKAFVHRSYLNESDDAGESNERMEFLGDSILQFLSSEFLYKTQLEMPEGELTNLRSRIVNTESLAQESARLGFGEHLLISRGEKKSASESKHLLANTFEAVLGAIYLEKGIDFCREYLHKQLFYKVTEILESGPLKDFKSLFQEYAQEEFEITPTYRVISEDGPDHQKHFEVGAYLKDRLIAKGTGSSKRVAQQEAAKTALKQYKQL